MALVLRELEHGDEAAFLAAYRAFQDSSFVFALEYDAQQPFADYVKKLENMKRGTDLPPDRVPATLYFGFVDGAIVGRLSFRHRLNEYLATHGGHIGYGVVPGFRQRGYAVEMLRQALGKIREQGLERVLAVPTNPVSQKVVEACAGVFEGKTVDGKALRYWIKVD